MHVRKLVTWQECVRQKTKRKWIVRDDINQSKTDATKEKDEVHKLDMEVPSSDSESDHLYAILQLGNKSD